MKPFRSILPLLLTTPALVPLVGAVASNPRSAALDLSTLPLPAAAALSESDPSLPPLSSDRLPARASREENETLLAIEPSAAGRASSALSAPPPLTSPTVVRLGDTLVKIAQRYGLTLAELLQLNPGLQTANLVVGSQVEVVRSAPGRSRMLLGLAPVGSGGLSWPELPRFGGEQRPGGFQRGNLSLVWPAQGTFTSGYGWRWGRMHRGIDIANNVGTPIVAVARGQVTFAGWHDGGYGYLVEITHDDGSLTRYGHNSALLVREGDQVQQGQVISQMGSTGRSTGPHLHFEIHPAGQGATNPLAFLPPRA
jgi:murein DD-endopeptidase MepM/ murein hydrolase activator NlpD